MPYRTQAARSEAERDIERYSSPRYGERYRRVVRWISGVSIVASSIALVVSLSPPVPSIAGSFLFVGVVGLLMDVALLGRPNTLLADYDRGVLHINDVAYDFATLGELDRESADEGDLELLVLVRGEARTIVARAMPPHLAQLQSAIARLRAGWERRAKERDAQVDGGA
jgi:hypothetical protein